MTAKDIIDLGKILAKRRKACGYTQSQVAKAIGTWQSTIAKIEEGKRVPKIDMLASILHFLKGDIYVEFEGLDQIKKTKAEKAKALTPGVDRKNKLLLPKGTATTKKGEPYLP